MIARKNGMDRRRYKRFKVPTDAFAVLKAPKFRIGQISDMSMGGLAFCYVDQKINPREISFVDILLADDGFYLDRIPVKIAWDEDFSDCAQLQPRSMKRCGLMFEEISQSQQALLASFVPKHAGGFLLDRRCRMRI